MPAINQVELHPFFAQEKAIETMKEYGIIPMAWGPLAEGRHGIFTHPVLAEILKLDLGKSEIVDHSDPAFVKMLHSLKIH